MSTISYSRQASPDEMAAEIDRRGRVIEGLEAKLALTTEAAGRVTDAEAAAQDEAVNFIFDKLAKAVGLESWTVHDGTETWDGDVAATLYGILRDAKVLDPETDELATVRAERAEAKLARIRKVRDDYASQARFADVEQASYFREFVCRLDKAAPSEKGGR